MRFKGHTLPTSLTLPPLAAEEVVWRDAEGRDWKPRELKDSHLANIIYHITEYSAKYSIATFEAMVGEADRRGFTQEYIDNAPYPFTDDQGRKMIADYSDKTMKIKPYIEIDHFRLEIGAGVIGITLDPTVFGDPVWKNDLPRTTKEAKYTANDIIPWTHDIGAAILTYWIQWGNAGDMSLERLKKFFVLLKVNQQNKFGITHLIVRDYNLHLYDPETS